MIAVRKTEDSGRADFGWLESRHSFSFGDYHDPDHMGFRTLRGINEDRAQSQKRFWMHGHRNMEILTYVLSVSLAHGDSMGNWSVPGPGYVQRMTRAREWRTAK